jgi:SAM-dependent methyltransferase
LPTRIERAGLDPPSRVTQNPAAAYDCSSLKPLPDIPTISFAGSARILDPHPGARSEAMNAIPNWWETFFDGLMVEFWRSAIPPEATRAEADFFEARLKVHAGDRILDVPCGHGRHSLELARRGYRMTGVDLSPAFLEVARRSGEDSSLRVDWRRGDMRALHADSEFDAAFCAGSSFGFFDDDGNADFLAAVGRAVKPGGRFLLDSGWIAESVLPGFKPSLEIEAGGIRFRAENRYEPSTGRIENRFTASREGSTESRLASHRAYTYRELLGLLAAAGFGSFEGLGGLDGGPFRLGSPRLILIARKEH